MSVVSQLKHVKETSYFTIMAIVSGILWLAILPLAVMGFFISIPFVIVTWISSFYFKAVVYGSSVRVTETQHPEIYSQARKFCDILNIRTMPDIFIVNSDGVINAVAYKVLAKKYVFIYSSMVDLMLLKGHKEELNFVIGHEIGHHAAGHVDFWKNLFLAPAKFIPLLGPAYSRACELTADRIGHHLINDIDASTRALASLASGSSALVEDLNIQAFKEQDNLIPPLMGFIHKLFSSHPRTTKRVLELEGFEQYNAYLHSNSKNARPPADQKTFKSDSNEDNQKFCGNCGTPAASSVLFCGNCGTTY